MQYGYILNESDQTIKLYPIVGHHLVLSPTHQIRTSDDDSLSLYKLRENYLNSRSIG